MKNVKILAGFVALVGLGAAPAPARAQTGTVAGRALYQGPAPTPTKLDRSKDPACTTGPDVMDPTVTLSKDGKGLANVFVRVVKGAPTSDGKPPSDVAIIDQVGCMYSPRVIGAMEGQTIMVMNGDKILHNVHALDGEKTIFNQAYPGGTPPLRRPAPKGTKMLTFKCDIHPWMLGYAVITKDPFYAVSDATGAFKLPALPPGTYALEAWHESLGTKTAEVTVEPGQAAKIEFAFGAGGKPVKGSKKRGK